MSPPGTGAALRRRGALGLLGAGLAGCALPGPRPLARLLPPARDIATRGAVLGVLELDGAALGGDGLSGLHVSDDLRLTAVGDRGSWCTARLLLDEEGAPLGLEAPRVGRLHGERGDALPSLYQADAESLARLPDGAWLVGFERWHRIRRYRDLDGAAERVEAPPGLEAAPLNGGLESLAVLADGRWLTVAEELPDRGDTGLRAGWIGGPGRWRRFPYRPARGFQPTDACPLPDGGALVLERRFGLLEWLSGRLVRVSRAALDAAEAGAVLEGEELLALAPPLPTDNWEGVSAFRHRGRLLAALVSDDNGLPIQRSLLMIYALPA